MTTNGPQAQRLQYAEAADIAAKLAHKWQRRINWSRAAEFARVFFECQLTEAETLHYVNALEQEQSDLSILNNLVREYLPAMLHLSPPVDFLHEYKTLDVDRRIRDLCELEGRILSEKQTPDEPKKPGPEFSNRKDAQAKYFKVWDYVSKPGNSAKSNVQIAGSTNVNKTMVGRILSDTRPPTAEELESKRTASKKR